MALGLMACAKPDASAPGVANGRLATCPDRPNCVSSDQADAAHGIAPLRFTGPPAAAWAALADMLAEWPRTTIATRDDQYLHALCRSSVFGFIDDLEFRLDPGSSSIAVRAAARQGYWDLGVNRRRVEAIRQAWQARLGG